MREAIQMRGRPHPARDRVRTGRGKAFGSPPPPFLSVAFMEKALAYEAQCKAQGGLPAATRRALSNMVDDKLTTQAVVHVARPGAHLARD